MKIHRNAISQVLAIVIIVAIIIAAFGGFLAGSVETQTPTSTSASSIQLSTVTTTASVFVPTTFARTTTQYIPLPNFPSSANTTNSTLGLNFALSVNSPFVQQGNGINVTITIFNILSRPNSISTPLIGLCLH